MQEIKWIIHIKHWHSWCIYMCSYI